ncbi:MAG: M14 family zinc carboxypeptidase [Planctomycetota bacterium]
MISTLRSTRHRIRAGVALLSLAATAVATGQSKALDADALWPPSLETYLPPTQAYDAEFPRPDSVLGWPVGTWHVRHDQLVRWFEVVAERSPRVTLERTGATHEQRPTLLATITSPANQARIEEIRRAHVAAVRSGAEQHDGPTVVWMGYGVHGNESSASNASLLLLYHLAAAAGPEIDAFLERTVVLIDPCVNPDGSARFAHWANMHRGRNLVGAPSHREHIEAWPGGRTNHYWFDLNRDWLLLTHPESRARVAQFQRWLPVVLTDYHEMGSNSTYFFQPGIPSRRNPLTPERNADLTGQIAQFHAAALDAIGSLYFTEENFDDFYYGKGSTYPDVQGGIGILFEQASSRGHLMETQHGDLTFPFTIRNQFTTSLTTLIAADALRGELKSYQRSFYRDAAREAAASDVAGWVFQDADRTRVMAMIDRLQRHGIQVHELATDVRDFEAGLAFVVPMEQPQSRLARALFETRTSWDDNTFYDVSSWTFPLSFDVRYEAIARANWNDAMLGDAVGRTSGRAAYQLSAEVPAAAYVMPWTDMAAAPALHELQKRGVRARVMNEPMGVAAQFADSALRTFQPGSILVPMGGQDLSREEVLAALVDVHGRGVEFTPVRSGLTLEGPDVGSGSYSLLETPKPLLLVGSGVSAYEAGEVWHDLDTRVGMAVAMVERDRFGRLDLEDFTHLVLVSGATTDWGEDEENRLRTWVRGGGHVVATKRSAVWVAENLMSNEAQGHDHGHDHDEDGASDDDAPPSYGDYDRLRSEQRVAGTIFQARVDRTHPLCYGFTRDTIPVFRNFEGVLPESTDPFATPVRYTAEPLLSGFASPENVEKFAGTPAVRAQRMGRGSVIVLVDDPVFRGVWYGTRRFLVNSIFFAGAIRSTGPIGVRTEGEAMDYDHGHAHDR